MASVGVLDGEVGSGRLGVGGEDEGCVYAGSSDVYVVS